MVENLREILTKRRRQAFHKPNRSSLLANATGEGTSSISKKNIVNQLGKHDFFLIRFFLWVSSIYFERKETFF